MSGFLKKLCWGRAIGVYFSGNRVSITDVANTIKGHIILNQEILYTSESEPVEAISKILGEYFKTHGGKNAPICIGLKPEQTFFITVASAYENAEHLRDKLLELAGFRNETERNAVTIDYCKIKKAKNSIEQLWGIGVCDKQFANKLYKALFRTGFKNVFLKPTPLSLSICTKKLPHKSKGWKCLIKIFLNEEGGLAILMQSGNPLCWRRFTFSHSDALTEIGSVIMTLLMQNITKLTKSAIDGFILAGPDAKTLSSQLHDKFGIETAVADGSGFTDSQCSYCLAISTRTKEIALFDLFKEVREKPSIMHIFPWKTAATILILAGFMAFMMWQRTNELIESHNRIKRDNSTHQWAINKKTQDIVKEQKVLTTEVESITKFLSTRIIWSDYLRDLPTRLPPNLNLSSIWGLCELKETGNKTEGPKSKKSFTIRGTTLFDSGRVAPEQIQTFLDSLKKVELLQRDFPMVQLGEIKWRKQGKEEMATFTVLALPKKIEKDEGASQAQDKKSTAE